MKLKQDLSIGHNLQKLRLKNDLTQDQVSSKLFTMGLPISREILSQMENGKYNVRISVLLALKSIYHASFDDFFEGLSLSE